ncbi:aspartate aminotransferase family protein [Planctomicrobium sp. SH664]|uniref:aspartate aminotransferase family protein n=1 Tax=Planctomicrobium sp. SH664 TaxID=3448125 RepID=UPI003F5B2D11
MLQPIEFPNEQQSNATRAVLTAKEPLSLRTFTPSQAVIRSSEGVFHWTDEGRRLYDFTSGVLVANLGHNPRRWTNRLFQFMGWDQTIAAPGGQSGSDYFRASPLTAYNAMTDIEARAVERLCASLQATPAGKRLQQVVWSASGSEAVQKALWACLGRDPNRNLIIATRYGFHGKKGLAEAVTGSESDKNRDPRVKFISFPMRECDDISAPSEKFDPSVYQKELDDLWNEFGSKICCLITEPYLGGGGSYHPPKEYHKLLEQWCRQHDILLIFDEVQANFGRTGKMYAFEAYGIEPDFVCLGKGLGNGIPVSAAVGRADVLAQMRYGETSDTWSANPLACASVVATLDEFESTPVLKNTAELNALFVPALLALKDTGIVAKVRGEGMVFGVECQAAGGKTANEVAAEIVRECYLGEPGGDGIHLLGALSGKVLRVSPPLTMTREEAVQSIQLLQRLVQRTAEKLGAGLATAR